MNNTEYVIKSISQNLKRARRAAAITVAAAAETCGVSLVTIYNWEREDLPHLPDAEMLKVLCELYNISSDTILNIIM